MLGPVVGRWSSDALPLLSAGVGGYDVWISTTETDDMSYKNIDANPIPFHFRKGQ